MPRVRVEALDLKDVSVRTLEEANASIGIFENAIDHVNSERGRMGAYEKRLEHAYQSQAVASENLTQAESRIRDTDMAEEMVNYTKNNILLQGAQSMLVHANMFPQNVLKLLNW